MSKLHTEKQTYFVLLLTIGQTFYIHVHCPCDL